QSGESKKTDAHWVATWATAQQLARVVAPPANPSPAPAQTAAAAAPAAPPPFRVPSLNNQTLRMILRTSIGGPPPRVKVSHACGGASGSVGAAHLARRGSDASIASGSDRPLTFAGKSAFTMTPGMVVLSDPVDLDVPPLTDLAVSLYFPSDTGLPTSHATG